MRKEKWSFENFKDRAKYKLGDVVYTIEIYNTSLGTYADNAIRIKTHTIYGLSFSTLCAPDPETCKIVYTTGPEMFQEYIFEDTSYATKSEALVALKACIERSKKFYDEKFVEYGKDLQEKYSSWMKYLKEQEETEGELIP